MDSAIELNDVPSIQTGSRRQSFEDEGLGADESRPNEESESLERQEFSLPKADSGKDAYLFLAACFVIEALVWGFPFAFGVFQSFYSVTEPFASDTGGGIATISTAATGIMYMAGLLLFPVYKRWPRLRRPSSFVGLPIMALSLLAASFANSISQLIMTQGVLYGIGGSLLYLPTMNFLDEWFVRRKGTAFGIMWAGTGAAGLVVPFIMDFLLSRYGFRTALRVWAVVIIALTIPVLYFVRPRLPNSASSQSRRVDWKFLRGSTFWLLQIGNIAEGLGYFMPSIYIPSFARSLGLTTSTGTLLLSLINMSAVIGTIIVGVLIDRLHVTTVILLSTVGVAISVFLLWGFSSSLPLLVAFCLMYGLFAGGFAVTNSGIILEVRKLYGQTDTGILLGLLVAGRGVGAIVSGPLSEALLGNGAGVAPGAVAGYGGEYGSLIIFTGVTATAGGVSFLGRRLGWL